MRRLFWGSIATTLLLASLLAPAQAQDFPAPMLAELPSPAVPANLQVVAVGEREITFAWDPSESAVGYSITRQGLPAGDLATLETPTFTDRELSPDSEYCYTVRAIDSSGDSSQPSAELCAATSGHGWHCPEPSTALDLRNYVHANDIAVHGNHAYTADDYGLSIWEASESVLPQYIASWKGPDECEHIAVDGEIVYVADRDGVYVIDAAQTDAPVELARILLSEISALALSGDHLFVGSRNGLLQVHFVGDPTLPQLVGEFSDPPASGGYPASVTALDLVGTLAYVTWNMGRFTIIDVSTPAAPALLGSASVDIYTDKVWGNSNVALVSGDGGTDWIDVSDPSNPVTYGSDLASELQTQITHDVVFDGDLAYLKQGLAFKVVDLSDHRNPVVLGENYEPDAYRYRFAMVNKTALLTRTRLGGFMSIDASDPSAPVLISETARTGYANGITISEDVALGANGYAGLTITDLTSPTNPVLLASIDTPGYASNVAVSGATAYVADGGMGLQILEISDRENPILLAGFETADYANDVAICGGMVAVAQGIDLSEFVGVEFVDVADPAHPVLVAAVAVNADEALSIAATETMVYLGTNGGLAVVDVSEPDEPYLVKERSLWNSGGYDLVISGPLLFATSDYGVKVLDISDPDRPAVISTALPSRFISGIALDGTTAVVLSQGESLISGTRYYRNYILDLADPWNPVIASELFLNREAIGAALRDGIAYVTANPFLEVVTLDCGVPRRGSSRLSN